MPRLPRRALDPETDTVISNSLAHGERMDKEIPTESKGKGDIRRPLATIRHALSGLEEAGGGRAGLLDTLSSSDTLTPEEEVLVKMLGDPMYTRYGLARLCQLAHISVGQMLRLFQRAKGAQAYVQAITRIYDKLPEIAEDLAARSLPHQDPCSMCHGDGLSANGKKPCPKCRGKGEVQKLPDRERQLIAFQVGGLIKQPGGLTINNQLGVGIMAGGPIRNTADFRAATDRILHPTKRTSLPSPPEEEPPMNSSIVAEVIG